MLELEADDRAHAKHRVGLNHPPSARFAANAAWLVLNVMAHNSARCVALVGLGLAATTKTL